MKWGGRAWTPAVLAVLSVATLCAPGAQGAAITLGQTEFGSGLSADVCAFEGGIECKEGFTTAQRSSAGVDVAPAAGVVVNWALMGGGPVALRVIEPAPGAAWRGAGTSSLATQFEGAPNATELPIEAGDLIGVDLYKYGSVSVSGPTVPNSEVLGWGEPPLGEGEARSPSPGGGHNVLQLNAEVELTPVVTSLSPDSGSTAGGNEVTISGKYLDSATNVVFGSRGATSFNVDPSGDRITAVAPPGSASTVDVTVSNRHSTSEPVAGDRYTYVAPPATTPAAIAGQGVRGLTIAKLAVSGFSESASRWRRGNLQPHISSTPVGTTFSFSMNEPASVALTFTRSVRGQRVSGRCVAPSHRNTTRPRCKRTIAIGSFVVAGHAGLDSVRFQGRLSSVKTLIPGSYGVSITTRTSHGLRALTNSLAFTVIR